MNTDIDNPNPEDVNAEAQPAPDANEPQIETATTDDLNAVDAAMESTADDAPAEPTIESLQAELADAEKRVLMAHADLDNFRRRTRREQQDSLKYASLPLMQQILGQLRTSDRSPRTGPIR
jgi:molecular chaperone GrpE